MPIIFLLLAPLSQASGSVAPGAVPPFRGYVFSSNASFLSGCGANVSTLSPWHFNLRTGLGGGFEAGNASGCGAPPGNRSPYYHNATAYGGVGAIINFTNLPKGTTQISADLAGNVTIGFAANNGVTRVHPKCGETPADGNGFNDTEWLWGYGSGGGGYAGFAHFAYVSDVLRGGAWTNTSQNVATVPVPFRFNGTTAYFHNDSFSTDGECSMYGWGDYNVVAVLEDKTTGIIYPVSGVDSGANFNYSWSASLQLNNLVEWGWDNASGWNGPGANVSITNFTHPTSFFSNNNTDFVGVTYTNDQCTPYASSPPFCNGWVAYGNADSFEWSNLTSLAGASFWWKSASGSYAPHDHYELVLDLGYWMEATNSWPHGYLSFYIDAAKHHNGFDLDRLAFA